MIKACRCEPITSSTNIMNSGLDIFLDISPQLLAKSGTGYQCQYATKSSFKSAKKITVKKLKTTKTKIKKLKKGKTYYIRVRNYKKVGKKVYYGPWSTVKKVKITK